MSDWSLPNFGGAYTEPAWTVVVTANASANAKGAYAEMFASTPRAGYLTIIPTSASLNYAHLIDVAIGAAGSEVVIASNLGFEWTTQYGLGAVIPIPIMIPAGTRVSCRAQCSTAGSKVIIVTYALHSPGGFYNSDPYTVVDTYGADTSDSGGTSVDPGGTSSTWGSYVEFTSSCTRSIKGIIVYNGPQLNHYRSDYFHYLHIAIGSAGSETNIAGFTMRSHSTLAYISPMYSDIIPVQIPIGSRISVRAFCSGNDASDRLTDVILYCLS